MKSTNDYVALYKAQLEKGDIRAAYGRLLKYLMELRAHFARVHAGQYRFGNISPGYMDYSYFPFYSEFLRSRKLRFGIVLNHLEMRFELWLMGQNADVQRHYWQLLKKTEWNLGRAAMPRYSVLEAVLVENPDFDAPEVLKAQIDKSAFRIVNEVLRHIPQ